MGTNPFVDVASLESDVNFGEIDASLIESMETLLSQVYHPLIAAQQDWGMNSEEGAKEFVTGMRKFVDGLTETVKSLNSGIELTKPDKKYEVENKQPAFNRAATDPEVLTHYEYVLEEWCKQMEKLVTESDTGRKESEDAGPNTELDYWKTRLSKFNSITEQLKTRECKSVLGVCTAAKSKILRRWKTLDNQITDSTNEAKVCQL
jgi:dynein heavy chain